VGTSAVHQWMAVLALTIWHSGQNISSQSVLVIFDDLHERLVDGRDLEIHHCLF
jgi:hypothetical protein